MIWRVLVGALVLVGAFVFLHSGARGADLCGADGFGVHAFSWWPPGTECAGGEPVFTETKFNPAMVFAPVVVVFLLYASMALRRKSE